MKTGLSETGDLSVVGEENRKISVCAAHTHTPFIWTTQFVWQFIVAFMRSVRVSEFIKNMNVP